ncbi:uncharacterized protein BKA78DRAFT_292973 [Phyllosticta capitalensis]|uniref:Apple domain-containing protein n=1 Tax=Phyllosticta capitalensis TaxID=121624 RepID=A0ABR1Z1G5_9PEZI
MHFTTLVSLGLATLTTALPTNNPITLNPRAGGPAYVEIKPPCYLSYALPSDASSAMRPTVATENQIYHWDQAMGDAAYSNETTLWTQCTQQCNGLTGCKAAFLAYNVPSEPIYSSPGGNPSVACRMFNVVLDESSFEPVTNGSYVQAMAANIDGCGK